MTVTVSPNIFTISSNSPFAMKGLSSTTISVCALDSSSTFFRFPNRVFSDITRVSRKLSIGGFVTWLKFWRKKWLIGRYWFDRTAGGVSSPIDAMDSLASSAMGARTCSRSSWVNPAALWRRRRASPWYRTTSGRSRMMSFSSVTFSIHSPKGWLPDRRSLISVSWYSLPSHISTAIICPGPSAPFSRTPVSSTGTMPTSEPAISRLSPVTT